MGTKGRDIAIWCYLITSLAGIPAKHPVIFWLDVFWLLVIAYHYVIEKPRAIRYKQVMLIPVAARLARGLTRGKIRGCWEKAYEIHIQYTAANIKEQRDNIAFDLLSIKKSRPGLYIWETSTSIPREIKKLIRELEPRGLAFWEKGGYPIPRPPFVYRIKSKKPIRHGAILVKEGLNA